MFLHAKMYGDLGLTDRESLQILRKIRGYSSDDRSDRSKPADNGDNRPMTLSKLSHKTTSIDYGVRS